jgi:hypothetical protein
VENGVACDLAEGILLGMFCLRWELRELVGSFIGEEHVRWCSGCGVVVMEQVRWRGGRPIASDNGGDAHGGGHG